MGKDIVRYDIYGTDVLIANKMESNGVAGNIVLSQSTKALLEDDPMFNHTFEKFKEISVKLLDKPVQSFMIKNLQNFLGFEFN